MSDKSTHPFRPLNELPESRRGVFTDSGFLRKLRNGAHEIHEVEFRGKHIFMRLLSVRESREAIQSARKAWLDIPENVRLPIMNVTFEMREVLLRALDIKVSNEKLKEEMQQKVRADELEELLETEFLRLYQAYEDLDAKYNPSVDYLMEDNRYMEIIDDLHKKKAATSNLSRLELEALAIRLYSEMTTLMGNIHTLTSVNSSTQT